MDESKTTQGDAYLLTQVSTDNTLENQIESVQDLVQLNSVAITKESVERINADSALDGRISELSNTQINDKAYLVSEIERHHDETGSALATLEGMVYSEHDSRTTSEARLESTIADLDTSVTHSISLLGADVGALSEYLDTTTVDSMDLTVDSEESDVVWSLLSASQEWRLEIDAYVASAEKTVTDLIKANEIKVAQAVEDSTTALENSDIDRVVHALQGKVGSDLLDAALSGQLAYIESSVEQTAREMREKIQQSGEELSSRIITEALALSDKILQESQERIDNAVTESARVQALIDLEVEELNSTIEDVRTYADIQISGATSSLEAALTQDLAELQQKINVDIAGQIKDVEGTIAEEASRIDDLIAEGKAHAQALDDNATAQAAALAEEAERMSTLVVQEAHARSAQVLEQAELLLQEIQAKAQSAASALVDKATALSKDFDTKITALRASVDKSVSALEDGITVATNEFRGKDSEIIASLNAYKVSNGQNISAIQQSVKTVTDAQASTAEELDLLSTSFNGLQDDVTQAQTDILTASKAIADGDKAVADQVTALKATMASDKEQFEASIATASTAISDLNKSTATTTQGLSASLKDVQDSVDTINGKWVDYATVSALNTTTTEVSRVNGEVVLQGKSISQLKSDLEATDVKTGQALKNAASAQSTADTAVTAGEATATQVSNLESVVSSNDTAVKGLITDVADSVTTLEGNTNTKLSELKSSLATTNGNVDKKADSTTLTAVTTRVTNAEKTLTSHTSSITSLNNSLATTNKEISTKASADALNTLDSKVTDIDGAVEANSVSIDSLSSSLDTTDALAKTGVANAAKAQSVADTAVTAAKANASSIDELSTVVSDNNMTTTGLITDVSKSLSDFQGTTNTKLTSLESSLATTNNNINKKADAASVNSLTSRVTTAEGTIKTQGDSITSLKNSLTLTEGNVSKKADTTALNTLKTTVEGQGDTLTSHGESLSALESSLDTVDTKANQAITNAAAAQKTADTAVTVNTAQAADLTSLNSRMTTTEGAIVKKADATALSSLATKVDNNETAMAERIDKLAATLTDLGESAETLVDVNAFNALKADATNTKGVVTGHTTAISNLQASLATVEDDAESNATAIKANADAITATNSEVSSVKGTVSSQGSTLTTLTNNLATTNANVNKKADATTVSGLTNRVTTAEGTIKSQGESITSLTNSLANTDKEIATKADATALSTLTNRVTSVEGVNTTQSTNITSLSNSLATANKAIATKADTTALNTLDSKVTEVGGKVTANTNSITSLSGRVATTENGLSTKADSSVLNNYYTKNEANSAIAGQITEFNASLVLGGENMLINSEAPRKGTNEYLMYENSAVICDFYDDNFGKPVTISFEISVPVAGTVTVYCSNGTRHTFSTSINVTKADEFQYFAVTVRPSLHGTNFNLKTSAVEFYGTYDTGRIVTVRKVQLERGTKASAWAPSYRDTQSALDTQTKSITANTKSIDTTKSEVLRVDGVVTAQGSSISKLQSDLTEVDEKAGTAITNAADAQNTANTAVTKIESTASTLSTLKSSYEAKIMLLDSADATNKAAITKTDADLSSAKTTLTNADTALGKRIDTVSTKMATDKTALEGSIKSVSDSVTTLESVTNEKLDTLKATVATNESDIESKLSTLQTTVTTKDSALAKDISSLQATMKTDKSDIEAKLTNVQSALTTKDNAIVSDVTKLQTRMTTAEGALTKKFDASAISDYYSKTDADKAVAGKLDTFNASLKIGGANLATYHSSDTNREDVFVNADTYYVGFPTGVALEAGKQYTFSVLVTKKAGYEGVNLNVHLGVAKTEDGEYIYDLGFNKNSLVSGERVVITFTPTEAQLGVNDVPRQYLCFRIRNERVPCVWTFKQMQVEEGGFATSWSPSHKTVQGKLDATTKAIDATNTEVSRVNGEVTTQGSKISGLESKLATTDATANKAVTAAANAQSTANTAVNKNLSTAGALDSLTAKFEVSAKAGANLLISSNVETTYKADKAYPHVVYKLGEAWEVGAKYTLLWCATHARASGDTTSSLAVYAGGGNQSVQTVNTVTKNVNKITFTKTSAGVGQVLNFYLLSNPAVGVATTATIHWAVLVKGDVMTTDAWIPSAYDYITANTATNATITKLGNTLADADSALATSVDNLSTSLFGDGKEVKGAVTEIADSVVTLEKAVTTKITNVQSSIGRTNALALPSEPDITQQNQWLRRTYDKTQPYMANSVIPDYTYLSAFPMRSESYEKDGALLWSNSEKNLNCVIYFRTIVTVSAAKTISFTAFRGDDAHAVFVDGEQVYSATANKTAAMSFDLTAGTHIIDLICNDGTGEAGFVTTPLLSSQVTKMYAPKSPTIALAGYNETINAWAELNKSQAQKIEKMTAELLPSMAGNEDLLVGDVTSVVGYEGVITQLADANAATQWKMDKFTASFADDFAKVDAKLTEVTELVASADEASAKRVLELESTFQEKIDNVDISGDLAALSGKISEKYITKSDATDAIAEVTRTLTSKVETIKMDSTVIPDTRDSNQLPQWYRDNYSRRVVTEFKSIGVIGASSILPGTYATVTTTVGWSDNSGGPIKQVAEVGAEDDVAVRYSAGTRGSETWTEWTQQGADTKRTLETSLKETTKTIDGVKAIKTITVDNNGVLSGYGLVSELVDGKVTSSFGVNADTFYIGKPADGKKVFTVANGVTTINTAIIGNLSADKITTGSFSADRIGAGTVTADKIKAGAVTADKMSVTSLSAISANLGTITSTASDGSKTVMTGALTQIYDAKGVLRVKLGVW